MRAMWMLSLGLLVGAAPLASGPVKAWEAEPAVDGVDRDARPECRLDGDGARDARPDRIAERPPSQIFPDRADSHGARRMVALQNDTGLGRPDLFRGFRERERRRDLERNAPILENHGWSDWRSDRGDAERRRLRDLTDGRVDWNRDWWSGRRDWETDWVVGRGPDDGAARDQGWREDRRPDWNGRRLDHDPFGPPRYYPPSGFDPG